MKKHIYFSLSLFLFVFLLSGCQKSGDIAGDKNAVKDILETAQKTIPELEGKKTNVAFSDTLSKEEEKAIVFRMRDYKDAPQNPKALQETEEALNVVEGNLDIRVLEIGETKEIDITHKANKGEILTYIIYEVKGRADNPNSPTIRPRHMNETGWDPAPQFVRIVDGDDKYPSSYYSRPLLKSKDYDAPLGGPEFTDTSWQAAAAVWKVPEGEEIVLAFKYIDMNGEEKFIRLQK